MQSVKIAKNNGYFFVAVMYNYLRGLKLKTLRPHNYTIYSTRDTEHLEVSSYSRNIDTRIFYKGLLKEIFKGELKWMLKI